MFFITAPRRLYTDRSLQAHGAAGGAVFSPVLEPPPGDWIGRRLRDYSSSTLCELYPILDVVKCYLSAGSKCFLSFVTLSLPSCLSSMFSPLTLLLFNKFYCFCLLFHRNFLSLSYYLSRVSTAALLPVRRRRNAERPHSISINHYESVCLHK